MQAEEKEVIILFILWVVAIYLTCKYLLSPLVIAQFQRVDKNIETMAKMVSANLTVLNARMRIFEQRINNLCEMQGVAPLKYSIRCNMDTKIVVDQTSVVPPSEESN